MESLTKQNVIVPVGQLLMPAYFVTGDAKVKRPGVIIFQEIFGVNKEMKRIADLLAENGYAVLVPNFYHRTAPELDAPYDENGTKEGLAAAGATRIETLLEDIKASVSYMSTSDSCTGIIGCWGFCFGGTVAYLAATVPGIKAAASFYGGQIAVSRFPERPPAIEFTKDITAPLFLAFGGKDHGITAEHVLQIKNTLKAAGKNFELRVYPDEGHAFFRNGVNGQSTEGARAVWPEVKSFFAEHLK